jgi:alkylhydroperoxidase/carboxymuconolactone decarboxylase family protein YurZ
MKSSPGQAHSADLNNVFSGPEVGAQLAQVAPTLHKAASRFWQSAHEPSALSPRMKELVLVAMHSTVTTLNAQGTQRHVRRALEAGATPLDVLDVLVTIAPTANHALYFALPVMMKELKVVADGADAELPEPTPEAQAIKDEFIRTRGVWLAQREAIFRLMPKYFAALSNLSTASWKDGSLSRKERELIAVAIDCIVTHMFEPGLAMHIRCALEHGAIREEVLDVFQLASLMGLETYIQGAEALFARADAGA